jgi:hypothetical protein
LNTPIILAFDSDKAGFSAAKKVAYDQLSRGVDLRVFIPPPDSDGKDIDDIFRDNPAAEYQTPNYIEHLISLCVGEGAVALSGSPTGGVFVGTNVNAGSFFPNNSGNFDVTYQYISPDGCSDSSVVNMTVLLCTGIENNSTSDKTINIYPNPASNDLYIHNELKAATVLISDASGRQVLQQEIFTGDTTLKINGLANGLYLVNIIDVEKHTIKKIKLIKN